MYIVLFALVLLEMDSSGFTISMSDCYLFQLSVCCLGDIIYVQVFNNVFMLLDFM